MSGLGGLKSVASRSMIGGAGSGSATGPGSVIGGAPVSSSTSPGSANVGTAGYEKDTEESMRTREGLDI